MYFTVGFPPKNHIFCWKNFYSFTKMHTIFTSQNCKICCIIEGFYGKLSVFMTQWKIYYFTQKMGILEIHQKYLIFSILLGVYNQYSENMYKGRQILQSGNIYMTSFIMDIRYCKKHCI